MAWACNICGIADESLRYRSGKIKHCKDCNVYRNLIVNAGRERKHVRQPTLTFSAEQYREWARTRARECFYCGVRDEDIVRTQVRTQRGERLETLGIDRVDNDRDYELTNIAFCCFACNKVKGNVFTSAEMQVIGRAVAQVWALRFGAEMPAAAT